MNNIGLVTGSASGLGYEFARLLANDAYDLILVDINETDLKIAAERLQKEYKVLTQTITLDLGKPGAAQVLYNQVKDETVEVLINNAGFGVSGLFSNTDWLLEESMIYLHVLTPTHLCKLILKDMLIRKSGKIMNIASVAAFTPGPLMNIYYATKGYLLSFGSALANELRGTGVTLTTACPGLTKTKFSETRATLSNVPTPKFGLLADSTEKVARIAYRAMIKGKPLSVPVFKNRLMAFFTWLVPNRLTINIIRRSQSKIQNQNT
jgi:short-subunit dehydrogenase